MPSAGSASRWRGWCCIAGVVAVAVVPSAMLGAERLSWWWLGIALAIVVACPTLRDPGSFYPTDVGQQDGYEVASSRQWG